MMILNNIINSYNLNNNRYHRYILSSLRCHNYKANVIDSDKDSIYKSSIVLKEGGLVAFPTETVYGLGANALNETSVLNIFKAKGRPLTDPLIVHVASKDSIRLLFDFNDKSELALNICNILCDAFWPGPLTIIYKASKSIPACVTAGTGYVGVRSPNHCIAQEILKVSGLPIAAPSANRFGHVSPTSYEHVVNDLGNEDITIIKDDIVRSGGCKVGIESTVVRVSDDGKELRILRCGAITSTDISTILLSYDIKSSVINDNDITSKKKSTIEAAVAPGQMIKHYAPDLPTYIITNDNNNNNNDDSNNRNILNIMKNEYNEQDILTTININDAFIIDYGNSLGRYKTMCKKYMDLSDKGIPSEACRLVFQALRLAEDKEVANQGVKLVLLPDLRKAVETDELLQALWERLHRAASGNFVK